MTYKEAQKYLKTNLIYMNRSEFLMTFGRTSHYYQSEIDFYLRTA